MKKDEMDPNLKKAFNELQDVPPRAPQAAAFGRANFLKEAALMRQSLLREVEQPHNRARHGKLLLFQGIQRLPALNALIVVILVVVVFFSGSGLTVYAAQDSLPDQVLYPVKTFSEDTILSLPGTPQERLNHVLNFTDRRVSEMGDLLAAEKPIPQGVEIRLKNELDLALELVAGMDDSQALQQSEQVRKRAEAQYQKMVMLITGAPAATEPLLLRTRANLQEQIRLASLGKMDLQAFRMQIQQHFQNQPGGDQSTRTPGLYDLGPAGNQFTSTPSPYDPGQAGNQPTVTQGQYGPAATHPLGTPTPSGTVSGPGPGGNQPTGTPGQMGPAATSPAGTPTPSGTGSGPGLGGNQPNKTPAR